MATLDFPNSPNVGDTYTLNRRKFTYNGSSWINSTVPTGMEAQQSSPSIASGVLTLNLQGTNCFDVSLSENITSVVFSNLRATGTMVKWFLILAADGTQRTITWPASVSFPGDVEPVIPSTNGKKIIVRFITHDGGTTVFGSFGTGMF